MLESRLCLLRVPPQASGPHRVTVLVPVSLDWLEIWRASSQRRPSTACPLQWLPMLLAGAPVPLNHRRPLANNVFTTKGALQTAVREYDDDVALAEAM